MRNWTQKQKSAIESKGNMIVSASAGSGKTTVMIENVLEKIENGAQVERLLMLTFTNAAAAEMREKLRARLSETIAFTASEGLKEQADALERADICTFHAFCAKLLRNHFEEADLDPSAVLADQQDADALWEEAVTRVFSQKEKDAFLIRLKNAYSSRSDAALRQNIKQIYDFSCSQPHRESWLAHACDYYAPEKLEEVILQEKQQTLRQCYALVWDIQTRYAQAKLDKQSEVFAKMGENIRQLLKIQKLSEWRTPDDLRLASKKGVLDEKLTARAEKVKKLYKDAVKAPVFSVNSLKEAEPFARMLISLTEEIAAQYECLKKEENMLTFSDLEQKVTRLLENEERAARIACQYDYIFVDEFQDTNRVQDYILSKIVQKDNLFVVGDVKQSIYRFRLTEPQIFIDRFQEFSAQKKAIGLNENFRSASSVLSGVNSIFERTMTQEFGGVQYAKEAKLIAAAPYPKEEGEFKVTVLSSEKKSPVGVYSVKNDEGECSLSQAEGRLVATQITELVKNGTLTRFSGGELKECKIEYSDIALLYQTRSDAAVIVSELKACGIPVSSELGLGAYDDFSQVMSFLRTIDNACQDIPLCSALCSYFGKLTEEEAAEIRAAYGGVPFWQAVNEYMSGYNDGIKQKLTQFFEKLSFYRRALYLDAYSLAKQLVHEEGFDAFILSKEDGSIRYESVIGNLENIPKTKSLSAFLAAGNKKIENSVKGKFVTCSTIHASKGLEYPVVFLVNAGKKFNMDYQRSIETDADYGLAVRSFDFEKRVRSETPLFSFLKRKHEKETKEEKLRLFYVALTRAKNRLYVSGEYNSESFTNQVLIEQNASSFMDWIAMTASDSALFSSFCQVEEVSVIKGDASNMQPRFLPSDKETEEAIKKELSYTYPYAKAVGQGIKYTVTEINKQREEERDTETPFFNEERETGAEEGVIYHKVMETVDLKSFDKESIEKHIEELIAVGELPRKLDYLAEDIARCLQSDVIQKAAKGKLYREQKFMLYLPACEILQEGGQDPILLQGVIDLVSLGEENVIVDYKFSNRQTNEIKARYKKQLDLYAQAAERALGVTIHRKIIYVFGQNAVIEID